MKNLQFHMKFTKSPLFPLSSTEIRSKSDCSPQEYHSQKMNWNRMEMKVYGRKDWSHGREADSSFSQ